jgi:superfamily II DNA or RNA helicase
MNSDKQKILITVPTGGGKAILLAEYASKLKGRCLIVVPNTELREQAIEKLKMVDPEIDVGSVQAAINEVSNKIIVATSLTHGKSKRIEQMLEHGKFDAIIFDEVHQAVDQVKKIIHRVKIKNIKIIGLTATPWNRKLNEVFDGLDYNISILDMILQGYLCEPEALMIHSKTNLSEVKTTAGEFNQKELEDAVDTVERNQLIVKSYQEYGENRKSTLVFCVGIEHLNHVVDEFTNAGIYCKGLDSTYNSEDRKSIIEEFKNGKLPVLVNCGVLTTGFDYPRLDCIILARPTKSKILYTQILGRGLRTHPDKNNLLVMDINDIVRKHDLMSISSVFEMPIKTGETVRKAIERNKKEKADEEARKMAEEQRKLERERLKQEEMRLIVERVKLFNKDMKAAFESTKYDFFKVDNLSYALTYARDVHYVIEDINNGFNVYNVVTSKEDKRIELIKHFDGLKDAIAYVEKRTNKNTYTDKTSEWKSDPATDNQRKFCSWAQSKWNAHSYFSAGNIGTLLKRYKREQISS